MVGIYLKDRALIRLAGMLLIEENDLVQRRYLSDHSIRLVLSAERTQDPRSNSDNSKEVATLNAGSDPNVLTTIRSYTTKHGLTGTRPGRVTLTDGARTYPGNICGM